MHLGWTTIERTLELSMFYNHVVSTIDWKPAHWQGIPINLNYYKNNSFSKRHLLKISTWIYVHLNKKRNYIFKNVRTCTTCTQRTCTKVSKFIFISINIEDKCVPKIKMFFSSNSKVKFTQYFPRKSFQYIKGKDYAVFP